MLTAVDESGMIISLAEKIEKDEILKWRRNKSFFCPLCNEKLLIKAGEIRIVHFSHKKNSNCTSAFAEPESIQHLEGKRDLHQFFTHMGLDTSLEYYVHEIQQRPDLLVTYQNKKYAIEYQCSPISRDLLRARTNGYKEADITPIWILGGLPFHKKHSTIYELTDFLFSLAIVRDGVGLSILSYKPDNKMIYLLTGIAPITSRKVNAAIHSVPLQQLTFPLHIQPSALNHSNRSRWIREKNKWLANKVRYGDLLKDTFLKAVYMSGENPFLLPFICGIPSVHLENFQSHPCEWQLFIYIDCLKRLQLGQKISLKFVLQKIRIRIKMRDILIRQFPLDSSSSWEETVAKYMELLVDQEYFLRIGEDLFELIKTISVPKTHEEAVKAEEKFYNEWKHPIIRTASGKSTCLLFGKQDL